tara:strand:- start:1 stop:171 length:171 start_codon:yes stop_codon:yes gene_type:complete
MTKINDPFGFTKTINSKVLNNPKVVKELSKMFNLDNERPEVAYKKAVNTLKRSIKR